MADEMLDLATLESGEVVLRTAPVDLRDLAQEVATRFTPVATRHGGKILVEEVGPARGRCQGIVIDFGRCSQTLYITA